MVKNNDLRIMEDTSVSTVCRILATIAIKTARERGQTKRWAVELLYANVGDLVSKTKCRAQIEEKW